MVTKEEVLIYYASEEFEPILPSQATFRHYRFKLSNGIWRKPPLRIQNGDDLKKWIVKLGATDIFYGTSQWLQPQKISSKNHSGTYHIADNLLLNNDLVFDVDAEEPITLQGLSNAKKVTSNLYELMKKHKKDYNFAYCSFTGHKGFRLVYEHKKVDLPANPKERIFHIEKNRKLFIKQLHKQFIKEKNKLFKIPLTFDEKITINSLCVIRVLNTVHSTTGYISKKISTEELRKPIKKLLDNIPYIGKKKPVIPEKGEMKTAMRKSPRPRLQKSADDVSGFASLPPLLSDTEYFITNKVLGIKKNFIPVFVYPKQQKWKEEIIKLQKKHLLGHAYIYEYQNKNYVICLKTMQKRNLQKVLNESTSINKHNFKKYARLWIPFNMDWTRKIPGAFKGRKSKGHRIFVKPGMLPHPAKKAKYVGWAKVELIRASKE